jgi:hypothetical protein
MEPVDLGIPHLSARHRVITERHLILLATGFLAAAVAALLLLHQPHLQLAPAVLVALEQRLLFLDFLPLTLVVVVEAVTLALLLMVLVEQAALVAAVLAEELIHPHQEMAFLARLTPEVVVAVVELIRRRMVPAHPAVPASSFFAIQSLFRP